MRTYIMFISGKWLTYLRSSRLLKLDNLNPQRLQLVDTSSITLTPVYVTLSHCWGEVKFYAFTEDTSNELYTGIDVSVLPKTFRDAVQIAKNLGAEYIVSISLLYVLPNCELQLTKRTH